MRIGRDSLTNTSRGVCYVEMNTVVDAMFLHNQLLGEPPSIDDKLVSVSYFRPPIGSANKGKDFFISSIRYFPFSKYANEYVISRITIVAVIDIRFTNGARAISSFVSVVQTISNFTK